MWLKFCGKETFANARECGFTGLKGLGYAGKYNKLEKRDAMTKINSIATKLR